MFKLRTVDDSVLDRICSNRVERMLTLVVSTELAALSPPFAFSLTENWQRMGCAVAYNASAHFVIH